jgi:DNA-3-methyladenine glycosylase II
VDQQIHYRSRGVYLKKLLTLLDEDLPTATNLSRIDEEHFVAMKISRQKYHALKNLATHWTQHQLQSLDWEAQSDEAVRQALLAIKGIGPWTVDMILLYTLGRPDVFPVGDYHLKKIMIDLYDLSPGKGLAAEMTNIAEEWAPYRSLAVLSLFAWQASQPSTASS